MKTATRLLGVPTIDHELDEVFKSGEEPTADMERRSSKRILEIAAAVRDRAIRQMTGGADYVWERE